MRDYHLLLLLFLLPFFLLLLDQSDCFVTQLPACGRYHGNFSVRHDNKYFNGKVGHVVRNVTRRECSLHCTLHLGCLFYNHKMDGTLCELMTSYKGNMTSRVGWQVVSTDLVKVKLRGPLCRYIGDQVCGPTTKYCEDTCEAPGFKCVDDVNIAKNKPATASSSAGDNTPERAVNGGGAFRWTSTAEAHPWLMVDLEERLYVSTIRWMSILTGYDKDGSKVAKMTNLLIRIGDSATPHDNPVCVEGADLSGTRHKIYHCTNGPMWGRYVVLTRTPGPVQQLYVAEVQIYVLD